MTSYCDFFSRNPQETAGEVLAKRDMSRDRCAGLMTESLSKREGNFLILPIMVRA
jgi:hypothetical protein